MAFQSLLPPTDKPPLSQNRWTPPRVAFARMILNSLSLTSWLLIGGLLQSIILLLTPSTVTLIPIITISIILLARLIHTLLITYHLIPNPYLLDAIMYNVAAQVPDQSGTFSSQPASEGIVCFHLGAKFNHPLGLFAPNVSNLGAHFSKMARELDADRSINGYLGGSSWTSYDARGAAETNFISYWRSIESIHTFAYGPTHRQAWEWWNSLTTKESQHIGINHEIFAAGPGQWEAIYANFQPTLLGATTYLKKGDKLIGGTVGDQWVNALVDARRGKLKSSAGRLGRDVGSSHKEYGYRPREVEYEKA